MRPLPPTIMYSSKTSLKRLVISFVIALLIIGGLGYAVCKWFPRRMPRWISKWVSQKSSSHDSRGSIQSGSMASLSTNDDQYYKRKGGLKKRHVKRGWSDDEERDRHNGRRRTNRSSKSIWSRIRSAPFSSSTSSYAPISSSQRHSSSGPKRYESSFRRYKSNPKRRRDSRKETKRSRQLKSNPRHYYNSFSSSTLTASTQNDSSTTTTVGESSIEMTLAQSLRSYAQYDKRDIYENKPMKEWLADFHGAFKVLLYKFGSHIAMEYLKNLDKFWKGFRYQSITKSVTLTSQQEQQIIKFVKDYVAKNQIKTSNSLKTAPKSAQKPTNKKETESTEKDE